MLGNCVWMLQQGACWVIVCGCMLGNRVDAAAGCMLGNCVWMLQQGACWVIVCGCCSRVHAG